MFEIVHRASWVEKLFSQADQQDLAAFERRNANARSRGLFFKNLYSVDKEEEQRWQLGQGRMSEAEVRVVFGVRHGNLASQGRAGGNLSCSS